MLGRWSLGTNSQAMCVVVDDGDWNCDDNNGDALQSSNKFNVYVRCSRYNKNSGLRVCD